MEPDLDRGHRFLEVMAGIAAGKALPDVLREIVRGAVDLAHASYGVLTVGDVFVYAGLDPEAAARLRADPSWPASGVFSVPIPVQAGFLHVSGGPFSDLEKQAVHAMSIAAAMAVRDARVLDASRRREAWLQASNEITEALLSGTDPGRELTLVASHARTVAGAPIAAIALPDDEQPGVLIFEVVEGADRLTGASIKVEGTASGRVFDSGEPLLIDNYGAAAAAWQAGSGASPPSGLRELGSAAIVPLTAGSEVLGVLLLCRMANEPLFEQADLDLLRNFAAHAALALQYAAARRDQQRVVVFEDRERIARDLHDLVIQRVFATGMALEAAAAVIPVNPTDAASRVRQAVDDLDKTIQEIRTTVFALQQSDIDSLRSLVLATVDDATPALGFSPSVRFRGPVDTAVAAEITEQMLPVLRESLSNVAKHARASEVSVEISVSDTLLIRVVDDGVGVPETGRRSGLANMATRAEQLGGTFGLADADPGTELTWQVPLR
ncbi:GAF domain-containing protein [Actinocrispum sp. NPDC049592]|uniref:GAF domain-containing sensor histidine kinase n=1 Tax=Actinocrispum sp. NPDC049592 TaxID=3154835 RepID=UPI0034279881